MRARAARCSTTAASSGRRCWHGAGKAAAAWVSGYGSWGEIEGDGNAAALDRELSGLFAGVELPLGGGWSAGLAGGRSRAELDIGALGSEAEVTSWHAAAHVGGSFGGFRLVAGGAVTWHEIETARSIAFTGFSDSAAAEYGGRTVQAFAEAGYAVPLGGFTVEPFAGAAWVDVETDAFTETGGAAALGGQSGSDDTLFTTLGLRGAADIGALSLTGSAAWRHAFGLEATETRLAFGTGTPFTVAGTPIAEDALAVEAGVEIGLGGAARLAILYTGQIADRSEDHGARATLSVPF